MNKKIYSLILGLGFLATAHAAPISTFVDVYDPNPDVFMSDGGDVGTYKSVFYTHNIWDEGYDPNLFIVKTADLFITIEEDRIGDPRETFRVILDDITMVDHQELTIGGYNVDLDAEFLQGDGTVRVKLTARQGDFWFRKSELTVTAAPVPEPGSIALLGLGLIGVGFAARRKKV